MNDDMDDEENDDDIDFDEMDLPSDVDLPSDIDFDSEEDDEIDDDDDDDIEDDSIDEQLNDFITANKIFEPVEVVIDNDPVAKGGGGKKTSKSSKMTSKVQQFKWWNEEHINHVKTLLKLGQDCESVKEGLQVAKAEALWEKL